MHLWLVERPHLLCGPPPPPLKISLLSREGKRLWFSAYLPPSGEIRSNRQKEKRMLNNLRAELVAKPIGLRRTAVSREMPFSLIR